jgi:hypothetical protein
MNVVETTANQMHKSQDRVTKNMRKQCNMMISKEQNNSLAKYLKNGY